MSPPQKRYFSHLSLTEARGIITDLFHPNPRVYWLDFSLTFLVGTACFATVRRVPLFSPLQIVAFIISSLLYYRLAMFIHELTHLRSGTFNGFRFAWNLVCGIPFLMPSFIYYTHIDHHRRRHYGTPRDGEYLPLRHRPPIYLLFFLAQGLVVPPLAVFRFLILSPLTWVSPPLRRLVHKHASSMIIDPSYIRPLPTSETLRTIWLQEFMCFLWCLGIAVIPPVFLDRWPIPFLIHAYCTGVFILTLNAIRTLGAHRWRNISREMTFLEQMLDSVNFPHRPLVTEIWGPVGTRYHALHHLFPSLPYHSMSTAHRRLVNQLPQDSPYHQTIETTLCSVLRDLWQRSASYAREKDNSLLERGGEQFQPIIHPSESSKPSFSFPLDRSEASDSSSTPI